MKCFKGLVINKKTNKREIVTLEGDNKTSVISYLRSIGYKVDNYKVKEKEVFDLILNKFMGYEWAWKSIKRMPENNVEYYFIPFKEYNERFGSHYYGTPISLDEIKRLSKEWDMKEFDWHNIGNFVKLKV